MHVHHIYKIENQPRLGAFQARAGQEKVKGLFCTLPSTSLEHCIVFGMSKKRHEQDGNRIPCMIMVLGETYIYLSIYIYIYIDR